MEIVPSRELVLVQHYIVHEAKNSYNRQVYDSL